MGRIEHTLLDEGRASSPTDLRPTPATPPLNPTIPHKVTNVSICDKRSEPRTGGCGGSDPMREAGVPSTGGWVVPAPPGILMVAPRGPTQRGEGAKHRPRSEGLEKARPRPL